MLQLDGRYEPQDYQYDWLFSLNSADRSLIAPLHRLHLPIPAITTMAFPHPSRIAPLLIAPLILSMAAATRLEAQANDMFPTKAAALQWARQLKCVGAFAMGQQWMPCKNLEAYENTVRQR